MRLQNSHNSWLEKVLQASNVLHETSPQKSCDMQTSENNMLPPKHFWAI